MQSNIMRSIVRGEIATGVLVDDRGQQRQEKEAPVPQKREDDTTSRACVCLDHRVDHHPRSLIEFLPFLRHAPGCAPHRHLFFLSVSVFLAVASSPLARSEQSKEVEFRELIRKYLKAEGCDRRFGGFGQRKNSFLVRAKEVARNLPDPVVEEIWRSTRLENFRSYTLPPGEYDCAMLR
jgi:hypothetical protein